MGDPTQSPLNRTIQTSQSARTEDKAFCIYCTVYLMQNLQWGIQSYESDHAEESKSFNANLST